MNSGRSLHVAEAQRTATLLEGVAEASPNAIFAKDTSLRFTYVNATYLKFLGLSREQVIGRTAQEIWPDFPAAFRETEVELLKSGAIDDVTWEGVTPGGESRILLAKRFALRANDGEIIGIAGVVSDIAGSERRNRELRDTLERLTAVADLSPNILWTLNSDARVDLLNNRWSEFTGLEAEAATRWWEAVHPADVDAVRESARRAREETTPWNTKFRLRHNSGEYRWVLAAARPQRQPGPSAARWVGSFTDIQAVIDAEHGARMMQVKLADTSRLHAMSLVASTVAHELNQPLLAAANYMNGAARFLSGPSPDVESVLAGLNGAAAEVMRTGEIIRRLRRFVATGEVERRPARLHPLVTESVSLALGGSGSRAVETEIRIGAGAEGVLADEVQIQQVLVNLIRNAADAMAGRPRPLVRVVAEAVGDGLVRVTVSDNGPGIDPEMADKLFTAFRSGSATGMGIGLSICRAIVAAHGGRIWVDPAPHEGAAFHFTLHAASLPEASDARVG